MSTQAICQTVTLRDVLGKVGRFTFHVAGEPPWYEAQDAAMAVIASLPYLTNAGVESYRGHANSVLSGVMVFGQTGVYQDIEDKATFTFRSRSGSFHHHDVPAPIWGVFDATSSVVDLAHPDVWRFVDAMLAHACTSGGTPMQQCTGGKRTRSRTQKQRDPVGRSRILGTIAPALWAPLPLPELVDRRKS